MSRPGGPPVEGNAVSWNGPEDPAETARWEAEKRADRLRRLPSPPWPEPDISPTARAWIGLPQLPAAPGATRVHRHARRSDGTALAITCFLTGAAAALGVVCLVEAALRALEAR